jgi:hypothetical protein
MRPRKAPPHVKKVRARGRDYYYHRFTGERLYGHPNEESFERNAIGISKGTDLRADGDRGFVYVIGQLDGTGPVKIGWSFSPEARLSQLQVGSPVRLLLIGSVPGTVEDEQALHARLAAYRLHGEWFSRSPAVEDAVTRFRKYLSPTEAVDRLREGGIVPA